MDCAIWSKTAILWSNANWLWSLCGPPPTPPTPVISIGNPPGVDATTLITPWMEEETWNPYRAADEEQKRRQKKRLIKLMVEVKGERFNEEKTHKKLSMIVGGVKMINAAKNIDLQVKE